MALPVLAESGDAGVMLLQQGKPQHPILTGSCSAIAVQLQLPFGRFSLSQFEAMTHPLIPQIIELATPVAASLGLDVVGAVFYTNQYPPVLRVDVRNAEQDTGLDDCERMSHALEEALDASNLIPDAYVLEISSPGVPRSLTTDREFSSFKGFPVEVTTSEPYNDNKIWIGQLVRRDDQSVYLSRKGRSITIPRHLISRVQLVDRVE